MKVWKKRAESSSVVAKTSLVCDAALVARAALVAKAARGVFVVEQLESRAMVQAGASLIEGWDIQLWWDGYGSGWTALQRERVGSDEWTNVELSPDGDNATYDDINIGTDPNNGLSPGLTYTYRLTGTSGTVDLGTYTTARYGDADLNGTVDDDDLGAWLDGYFSGGSTWQQGDFNNDGTVDAGDDWSIFLAVYSDPSQAPTTSVHGNAGVGTGAAYTLDFNYDSNIDPADYWIVNWGDGSDPQLLPGYARSAQHTFASSGDFDIQVGVAAAGSRDLSNGTFSAGDHVIHVQAPAAAPSGVGITGTTQHSVSVAWTNNATNANAVIVNVTQNGSAYNSYTLPATQNTLTLDGLDQNTTYGFSISAQNYAGTSAATTEVAEQTNPAAPTSVIATPDGDGHLVVTWADNTNSTAGYVITGDNGAGASTTLATVATGGSSATIAAPPSGSTVPITVTATRASVPGGSGSGGLDSTASAVATATIVDQPASFGTPPGTWSYAGANPSHLQNDTVTGNLHDIPTHNNLALQWEPFDADPGFSTGDTATRTITVKVDGTTAGTVSYIFDSFDSDGTAEYHQDVDFSAGLGTANGGEIDVTNVAHSASTATVTFTGADFSSTGFWTLNTPSAVWSRPIVQIISTKGDGTEAISGDNYVEFKVIRGGNLTVPLVVDLEAPTGTATAGVDYSAIPTSVTIPAGSDNTVVDVSIIDDTIAEGPESIGVSIKPSPDNKYALGTPVKADMTIHDNPSVSEIDVDVVPPPAGASQFNVVAGFNFYAKITVKGEALDETTLDMQVQSTTSMLDAAGLPMTASEIAGDTGLNPIVLNSATPTDVPGYSAAGLSIVDGTHAGVGTNTYNDHFNQDTTGFPVGPDYYTNIVDLSRQYTIKIFADTDPTTPIGTMQWSYSWTNKGSQYQAGQLPAPPLDTVAVSYNNNNKGTFYNINGINGLAALN